MDKKYIFGILVLLTFGMFLVSGCETKYTQEEVNAQVVAAEAEAIVDMYTPEQLAEAETKAIEGLYTAEEIEAQVSEAESVKDATIEELNAEIVELTPAPATPIELGYTYDELAIGESFYEVVTDRHIETLFDGEVEFDGDDYNVEEKIYLSGTIGTNGEDYDGEPYLEIPEETLVYEYIFSDSLVNAIKDKCEADGNEDETVTITLLGKEIEISDWDTEEGIITLTSGTEYIFEEGESKEIDGQNVTVTYISDTTNEKIQIKVGVETAVIKKGETESFDSLDVYVKEVLSNEAGEISPDIVTLKIGKDIKTEIKDDEYYSDDEMYMWIVVDNVIGLKTAVDYIELDDDYTPFKAGESLILPNDFRTITFNGLIETDYQKITIEEEDDNGYKMYVKGNFIDSEDNDITRIFVNKSGFYDKDGDEELLITSLDIEGTDSTIKVFNDDNTSNNYLKIGEIYIQLNFESIYDGTLTSTPIYEKDVKDFDYTYLSNYGITVSTTEDLEDDKDLTIYVPEEELFGSITVY